VTSPTTPPESALALDHVVVGASDLEATVAFFVALGLAEQGRAKVPADVAAELHGVDGETEEVVLAVAAGSGSGGVRVVSTPLAQADRGDFFRGGHAIDFYTTDMARSVVVAQETGAEVGPVADYEFGPVHLTQA
jgi:catechol 2,3-dioxygenase-like lactoylglutathione lyase family enzyme